MHAAIYARLIDYLTGQTTLHAFLDWLVAETWDRVADADPALQALVGSIELLYAEYTNDPPYGLILAEFQEELRALVRTQVIPLQEPHCWTGTSATTIHHPIGLWPAA